MAALDSTHDFAASANGASPPASTRPTGAPTAVSRHPRLVFFAVLPGIFVTLADATIMSVAIPRIIRELDASVTGVSWVMNGYNLVLTVLFLPMGRLADRYGHRRLFLAGLAAFTAASLGCASSDENRQDHRCGGRDAAEGADAGEG